MAVTALSPRTTALMRPWVLPLAVLTLAFAPWMNFNFSSIRHITLIAIFALVVSGLNLSFGYAGELALGQGAVFAAGAYVTGWLSVSHGWQLIPAMLASIVTALIVGVASGAAGLRLGGWSLAIVSFFLVLMIPDVLTIFSKQTGSYQGLPGIAAPDFLGHSLDPNHFYVLVIVVCGIWFVLFRNLVSSAHGAALKIVRDSPILAIALGISVYRTKLIAYAIAAIPAGIAGCLFAYIDQFISPSSFTFITAVGFFAASIIGGAATVYGAVLGAALLQLGPQLSTSFQDYSLVVYGAFLLIAGVALSGGLSSLVDAGLRKIRGQLAPAQVTTASVGTAPLPSCPGEALEVRSITRTFGGVKAVDDVSLTATSGSITALIGPNGSGKTTLLNAISGYYRADSGSIMVGSEDLTTRSTRAIARHGVARTFQTPQVPEGLSTVDVVATGRYAHSGARWLGAALRTPGFRRTQKQIRAQSLDILQALDMEDVALAAASKLPLGTRRMLELARCIAAQPRVMLLDEVASGLDEVELEQLCKVIVRLRDSGATILLVEHNFPLVLRLADMICVLAEGSQLVAGSPEVIAEHPEVLSLYLGTEAVAGAVRHSTVGAGAKTPTMSDIEADR